MRADKLIRKLGERYGDRVVINSEYHIQVDSDKGLHDIWLNRHGEIKFKPAGNRNIIEHTSVEIIFKTIDSMKKTHVESMQEMLDVAQFIGQCEQQADKIGNGIFADAGFKDGKARIAAVMMLNGDIEAKATTVKADNIIHAEQIAIELALDLQREHSDILTVYNDNQTACKNMQNKGYDCVKWLSRKFTKAADKIGNMRSA